jgi:geranylgeranyl reductase family protein
MTTVAVLGGGPAGAFAAERLARAGFRTLLFDEKLAWEKPCGGGLTHKAYQRYPFLIENAAPKVAVREMRIAGPTVGGVALPLDEPLIIYSRFDLNALLLERAQAAGAEIEKTRVLALERRRNGWNVRTRSGSAAADFCIVATGARNPLRDFGAQWTAADSMCALGYYVPGRQEHVDVQFLPQFQGYIWVFPRCGHLSVGICGKRESSQAMRERLRQYMSRRGIPTDGATFYAHLIPGLETPNWKRTRLGGEGWLAAGDAAGLVDPVTGEGLYYALRSADLAADALISQQPDLSEMYRQALWREFVADLEYGASISHRVFLGRFLGGAVPDRMVQFARRSRSFAQIIQELVSGAQSYLGLRERLIRTMKIAALEMALNPFGKQR